MLVARNQDALRDIADRINAEGGRARFMAADIADEGAPHRIADFAEQEFGGFDAWVNNAAVALFARLDETTMKEHRQIFDVGYFGLVNASLIAAQRLRDRGGAIINVGSILSERAAPIQGAYSAMKHAVQGFTEGLRMELEMQGAPVSVTLVKPAGMHTPYPQHARNRLDRPAAIPPRVYDPRLVAEAICHAASHTRRSMTVGGQGLILTKLANLFPRTTDRLMERLYGEEAQSIDQPPPRDMHDNLFEPRRDGQIESDHDQYVRRRSFTLKAQMHPVATVAMLGGAAIAAAGLIFSLRARRRTTSAAPIVVQGFGQTSGGGSGAGVTGPSRESQADEIRVA